MKALKIIGLVLGALIGLVLLIPAFLPNEARVERSIVVNQSADLLYPYIADLKKFNSWSPWKEKDPNTQYSFSEQTTGPGAWMRWSSEDPQVGKGLMEIKSTVQGTSVTHNLAFGMDGDTIRNESGVHLEPAKGGGTQVVWWLQADELGYLPGRYFGQMLDAMVGPDYEKGLEKLKAVAESQQATPEELAPADSTELPMDEEAVVEDAANV